MFNPALKVVDAPPPKEKKPLPVAEGKEDLDFKLFEQAVAPPPPVKGAAPQTKHPHVRFHTFIVSIYIRYRD